MPNRDLDVVVLGATGVTGRRVAAYLAERAPALGATWGAAARNRDKLAGTLAEAGIAAPATLVADVGDPTSLRAVADRAKVVLNAVGPYTTYGRAVIEACVAGGAHYVDLTGELPFVREINEQFHARAQAAGVKVVQAAGFESLPPDLAIALAADTATDPLATVDVRVSLRLPPGRPRVSDALSGGTLQTIATIVAGENPAAILDPAILIDDPGRAASVRRVSPIMLAPRRSPDGEALAPMAPAPYINPGVIQRSACLRRPDDPPFRFREGIALGGSTTSLPVRLAAATALSATQVGLGAVLRAPGGVRGKLANGLARVLPDSGFGPAADRLDQFGWRLVVDARTTTGAAIRVTIDADGHPGYKTTATMLGEAGLGLAEVGATPERFGCVPPAVALGTGLIQRFEHAGMRFRVG